MSWKEAERWANAALETATSRADAVQFPEAPPDADLASAFSFSAEAVALAGEALEKSAKLGTGKRFEALASKLQSRRGKRKVSDPKALAAWIGRKKYGKKRFQRLSARERKSENFSRSTPLDETQFDEGNFRRMPLESLPPVPSWA